MPRTPATQVTNPVTVTGLPWHAKAITPSSNDLTNFQGDAVAMTVFVGTGGNVNVLPVGNPDGSTVVFAVPTGGFVPVLCRRVLSDSTTATGLVGVF